jgi:hypothetical protein
MRTWLSEEHLYPNLSNVPNWNLEHGTEDFSQVEMNEKDRVFDLTRPVVFWNPHGTTQ